MLTLASVCYENFVSILFLRLYGLVVMWRPLASENQEDQATLSLTTFNKEKLVAVQQVPEGMTQPRSFQQCLPRGQTNILKGPVKRQVVETGRSKV